MLLFEMFHINFAFHASDGVPLLSSPEKINGFREEKASSKPGHSAGCWSAGNRD